jgi:gamma-butyrobetaine dioxygenase
MQVSAAARETASLPVDMRDLANHHTDRTITKVSHTATEVTLLWDDGRISTYDAIWLRDNCPCPKCRHPQALERTYKFIDHVWPEVSSARKLEGDGLDVEFNAAADQHVGRFSSAWLRRHCYSKDAREEQVPRLRLWDAEAIRSLPIVDFSDYMNTEAGLRAWIDALCSWGIVLLRGVPAVSAKLLDVARHIGPVRTSNFGEYYDVVSMPNPNAVAYTAMALELHTDLANWRFPPDYQLLSCLKNDVLGGGSVLADGFRVAEDLRREAPAIFNTLTSHPIDFRFHDATCDIQARGPTIATDESGRIVQIRFNNWLRSTLSAPEESIRPIYDALEEFWKRLRDPKYHLTIRLKPGELFTYSNNRVLHGRESFDPNSGHRHLQGCYITHEDVVSKLRLLNRSRK